MKTQTNNAFQFSVTSAVLVILLVVTACAQKKESVQAGTQTKAAPPQVDIHTAVITNNIDALKQHITAGSDLNEKDPLGGSSPLISACLFGKTEMAKILLDAGVNLNFQNNDGSTALHTAAFFCRPEIVKMLLSKGADKTIKNKYGQTAYQSVAGPYADVKPVYEGLGKMLEPMGFKLDYVYLEKARPEIAAMLK